MKIIMMRITTKTSPRKHLQKNHIQKARPAERIPLLKTEITQRGSSRLQVRLKQQERNVPQNMAILLR